MSSPKTVGVLTLGLWTSDKGLTIIKMPIMRLNLLMTTIFPSNSSEKCQQFLLALGKKADLRTRSQLWGGGVQPNPN